MVSTSSCPGLLELLHALVLEHGEHVVEVDADSLEALEDLLGVAAAGPMTVSPSTSPWSANASRVFSGIVLTVSATTRSVTYIVSG